MNSSSKQGLSTSLNKIGIHRLFEWIFNIRKEELFLVHLFFFYIILISMFYTVGSTTSVTLFLNKLPPKMLPKILPWIYIVNAFAMILVTWSYRALLHLFSRITLVIGVPTFFAISFILFRQSLSLFSHSNALYFFLFVWIETCGMFLGIISFSYMGDFFNVRDARRLYGYISGGTGVGAPLGGSFAILLLRYIPVIDLLYVCVILLISIIGIAYVIFKKAVPVRRQTINVQKPNPILNKKIISDRYLRKIFFFVGLSAICTCMLVFQMFIVAGRSLDEVHLAKFFATLFSLIGIAELFMTFVLARIIMQRFGVIKNLLIQPILFVFGCIGFIIHPMLIFAAGLKFVDSATLTGISREMLFLPLSNRIRIYSQSLANGVIGPMATVLAGSILVLLSFFSIPIQTYSFIILILAVFWIIDVMLMRADYRKALAQSLTTMGKDPLDLKRLFAKSGADNIISGLIQNDNITSSIGFLKYLPHESLKSTKPLILSMLQHEKMEVVIEALNLLAECGDKNDSQPILSLMTNDKPEIQAAAIYAYCRINQEDAYPIIEKYFNSEHKMVAQTSLINGYQYCGTNARAAISQQLYSLLENKVAMATQVIVEIGDAAFEEKLINVFNDKKISEKERYTVLKAIGKIGSDKSLFIILTLLSSQTSKMLLNAAVCALESFSHHKKLPALQLEQISQHQNNLYNKIIALKTAYQEMGDISETLRQLYYDEIIFYMRVLFTLISIRYNAIELKNITSNFINHEEHIASTRLELIEASVPRKLFYQLRNLLQQSQGFKQDIPSLNSLKKLFTIDVWIEQLTIFLIESHNILGDFSMPQKNSHYIDYINTILFLKSVNIFKDVPANYLVSIVEIIQEQTYYAGEYLFREDEVGDSLFIIRNGKVKIIQNEKEISEMGSGECFGELSLLDNLPRSASALAFEDSLLLKINSTDFNDILNAYPEVAQCMLHVLATRLRETTKKLTDI